MTNSDIRKEEGLKALGAKTRYRMDYAPDVLETFVNKHQENDYWVRFNCPEFTSLCPIEQEPEALPFQLPQPRRLPRRLREHNNERPHPPDGP